MGLGLQGAYGLSALQQMIRQRITDQLAQKQQDFQNQITQRSADRADAQLAETSAWRKAQEAETTRQHDLTAAEHGTNLANALGDQLPAGAALAPTDPAVGLMTKGGRGSLLTHEAPTMASESLSGFSSLPGGPKPVTGMLRRASDAAQPERYIKQASAKQQDTQADNARQAAALQQTGELQDWKTSIQQQLADAKGAQGPTSSYQLQPELDPKTGQQTGRFLGYNTKLNRWEPVQGQGPGATKAAPGAAQANQEARTKTEALDTLSQLDTAITDAKDLIGPGHGRVSNIEQMIGSADPRIQALGVKMKATKMRVDHAITGSVRAGASPSLLAQWDNILANQVTPEGLKAAVQAMREILGGASGGSDLVHMVAPDGRSLSVPPDKVAELEKLGAKRR